MSEWDNADVYEMSPGGKFAIMDRDVAKRMGKRKATMAERAEYLTNIRRVDEHVDLADALQKAQKTAGKKSGGCGGCGGKKKPPKEDRKLTMAERAKGSAGLIKSATGYDMAPAVVQEARWQTCLQCENNLRGVCQECGCHVSAKLRIQGEACPLRYWPFQNGREGMAEAEQP